MTGIKQNKISNKIEQDKLVVQKIDVLRELTEATCIDQGKTIISSEPVYKPVFEDQYLSVLKLKILELVEKL